MVLTRATAKINKISLPELKDIPFIGSRRSAKKSEKILSTITFVDSYTQEGEKMVGKWKISFGGERKKSERSPSRHRLESQQPSTSTASIHLSRRSSPTPEPQNTNKNQPSETENVNGQTSKSTQTEEAIVNVCKHTFPMKTILVIGLIAMIGALGTIFQLYNRFFTEEETEEEDESLYYLRRA